MRSNPETRNRWLQRVEEFKASGLTRKAYCEKYQINVSTLDYWREKLESKEKRKASQSNWIPLEIDEGGGSGIDLRIGKFSITIKPGFDRALLVELLQIVASC